MVTVLFPFPDVESGSLQMSVLRGADPYIFPGWRNDKLLDSLHVLPVGYGFVVVDVGKSLSLFDAFNARIAVLYIHEIYRLSALRRIPRNDR